MADHSSAQRRYTPLEKLELHQEVRKEMMTLISSHRYKFNKQPPFSTQELIIMALLSVRRPGQSLSSSEIMAWILETFKYYNNKAMQSYALACIRGHTTFDQKPGTILHDFFPAFDFWEAPIYNPDRKIATGDLVRDEKFKFTAPAGEARIFLRKWLDCKLARETPFDFKLEGTEDKNTLKKLPPEVRKVIFEMVFAVKWPGLIVRKREFKTFKPVSDTEADSDADVTSLRLPPVQYMLALLSVSKEVYRETLPCFYSENNFFFDTLNDFARFARNVAPERRSLLRNIVFMYNSIWRGVKGFEQGAKMLTKFKKLRCLEVGIVENTWFSYQPSMAVLGKKLFVAPNSLPGIDDIAFSLHRAGTMQIHGPCPRIKRYLEDRLARLNRAEKTNEVEKLRTADELANAKSFKDARMLSEVGKFKGFKRMTNDSDLSYD